MSLPTRISTAVGLLCVVVPVGVAHGQSVGVGLDWLRDGGADFPGGPGLRVEATAPIGRFLGVRAAVARSWGSDTRVGTLCTGLLPPGVSCVQELVEHRSTTTAEEAFLLGRTPPLNALRMTLGVGLGHYAFDVSRYGQTSAWAIYPVDAHQEHRWVPAYLAELEIQPDSWGRLGVTLGVRTATVEFRGLVADAWGLSGRPHLTRVSVTANYQLR